MMIQKYLDSVDRQIFNLKMLGLSNEKIKKRLITKYKNMFAYNKHQTKHWLRVYEFIVNNQSINGMKFYKD